MCDGIALRHPPRSALANHIHRFDPLQRPPRRHERAVTFRQPDALLHRAMVLFYYIIQVLALAQLNAARQNAFCFQRFHCRPIRGVLVHVDHPRDAIARSTQSPAEEAFGSRSVPFGGAGSRSSGRSNPRRDTDGTLCASVTAPRSAFGSHRESGPGVETRGHGRRGGTGLEDACINDLSDR